MKLIKLPDFIKTEYDIYKYFDNISKPNFITLNSIFGETIELKDQNLNKILCIFIDLLINPIKSS